MCEESIRRRTAAVEAMEELLVDFTVYLYIVFVPSHFDTAALTWDESPERLAMAERHVQVFLSHLKLRSDMTLLDYGAGTGLVSLGLRPHVGSVIGMEPSQGMADRFREKIVRGGLTGVDVRVFDPQEALLPGVADGTIDVIVSTMTFHHIEDIGSVLREFHRALKPGGQLGVIDLETEDGSFHDDPNAGVLHHGFSKDQLETAALAAGFDDVTVETASVHLKKKTGREYPVLLLKGRR